MCIFFSTVRLDAINDISDESNEEDPLQSGIVDSIIKLLGSFVRVFIVEFLWAKVLASTAAGLAGSVWSLEHSRDAFVPRYWVMVLMQLVVVN
jgi:hypothetical protein